MIIYSLALQLIIAVLHNDQINITFFALQLVRLGFVIPLKRQLSMPFRHWCSDLLIVRKANHSLTKYEVFGSKWLLYLYTSSIRAEIHWYKLTIISIWKTLNWNYSIVTSVPFNGCTKCVQGRVMTSHSFYEDRPQV